MGFSVFDFHPAITAGLRGQGYAQPTPIQEQAIPSVLEGRDCLGLARPARARPRPSPCPSCKG